MKNCKKIDVHTHYLPPAYYGLLAKHGMSSLDGDMPVPEWTPEKHLEDMGFVAGGAVTVLNTIGGNLIVKIKESRVAISKEMAQKIMV